MMTAEEFFELPEPFGFFTYELQFGELVQVARPKKRLYDLQGHTRDVLMKALGRTRWLIQIKVPYGLAITTSGGPTSGLSFVRGGMPFQMMITSLAPRI